MSSVFSVASIAFFRIKVLVTRQGEYAMSKKFVLRKPFLGIALLIAGLLSACGGGGGGSGPGGANSSIASLALFAGNMGGAGTAD